MRQSLASPLEKFQGIAYAAPVLATAFLSVNALTVMQGIYAKYFGLSLSAIATVLLVARVFDAITDPLIGYWADKYYYVHGTRKPFVFIGVVLFFIASWFLYAPGGVVSEGYFLFWMLAFYFAHTFFEIPHLAWAGAISINANDKSRLYGVRTFFVFSGGFLFFVIPLLPFFDTSELTPHTMKYSVIVASVLAIPLLIACVSQAPDRVNPQSHQPKSSSSGDLGWRVLLLVFANRPFLVVSAAHLCTGLGAGVWYAVLFIYADIFLGLGGQFAVASIISLAISIASLRLWYLLILRLGKRLVWAIAMGLAVAGFLGCGLMQPGSAGITELTTYMTMVHVGLAAFGIVVPSLISDVSDYGQMTSGIDQSASYFSVYAFSNKAAGAIGAALGFSILAWSGFEATSQTQNSGAVLGLTLGISWVPMVFFLISVLFILNIPISEQRHAAIRRRLNSREFANKNLSKASD